MNKNTATSMMFEEIRKQLQDIEKKVNYIGQNALNNATKNESEYTYGDVKEIIESIKIPHINVEALETIIESIHFELKSATERIEKLVQKKEEDKVVSHVHSIHFKSAKVCIAFAVLYILLMISVWFNFR